MCDISGVYEKEGYICLSEEAYEGFSWLDNKFKEFLMDMNFKEYHIPSLIDGDILRRCGYFDIFPHILTVIGTAKEEECNNIIASKIIKNEQINCHDKYLTPAACLHIYPMLENQKDIQGKIITTRERVYRYEGEHSMSSTRLWEFTVREIVFVGSPEFVRAGLESIKGKSLKLAKLINDSAFCESASDKFYNNRENNLKSKIQKVNSQKEELIIPIQNEKVAVCSFNYHGTHFSRVFNFDNGEKIVTGCVGFGIERWLAAFLESEGLKSMLTQKD